MKKTILISSYKLKVFNDGSSGYVWTHPWKGWIVLTNKDLTCHPKWNQSIKDKKVETKTNYLQKYTKSFKY